MITFLNNNHIIIFQKYVYLKKKKLNLLFYSYNLGLETGETPGIFDVISLPDQTIPTPLYAEVTLNSGNMAQVVTDSNPVIGKIALTLGIFVAFVRLVILTMYILLLSIF